MSIIILNIIALSSMFPIPFRSSIVLNKGQGVTLCELIYQSALATVVQK